ncbi:MAG: hypothetical protein SFV51_18650 [Bryobacteraceae bacterium]|nr:hypothetical protein [Bryobacteraceae bacterium]
MRLLAALVLLAAALAGQRVKVTETAGLARSNEPVTLTIDGKERTLFVSIGANQTRTVPLNPKAPAAIRFEQSGRAGFLLDNGIFAADHSPRVNNGKSEDSGTLRKLTHHATGAVLLRTENRMHWAPSFQRVGAKGYTSIATWDPVQKSEVMRAPGVIAVRREGFHALYPEIGLKTEYRFFAGVPYFLFHAATDIRQTIDMFWMRAQEMTMDDLFTHVAWPGRLVDFETRKAILEKDPLPVDLPWIAFLNMEKGYGFGAVILDYKATTTANARTMVNDGARNGKYWDRYLVGRVETRLNPGDRYEERTAYVLFRVSKDQPLKEFQYWQQRLHQPLRVELLR